eukprot:3293042-Pleurochrysis_carterae.AAC.2
MARGRVFGCPVGVGEACGRVGVGDGVSQPHVPMMWHIAQDTASSVQQLRCGAKHGPAKHADRVGHVRPGLS